MCGRDLRKMATTDASASERWLSGLLAGTPEKHQLLLPKMTVTSVAALSQRIQTLCELSDPRLPAPRRNSAVPLNLEQAREFLRPLDSLLTAWPIDFKTHVARRLEAASPSARTLNGALGLWYTRLKRYSIDEQEEPFLRETLRAVNEHAPGLLGLDGADKSYGEIQQVCSVRDAAARLGVGRDTLAQAVERGQVKARTRRYGTRRLMYQIPIPELERLEVSRAAWVDEARAMALLDVPAAVIANLKASGELTFDLRWREDITKSGPISLDSVTRLLMTIREQVDEAAASDDFIVLRDLTSRRVGDKKAIADLYVAITSGALRGVGRLPTRGIGSVRYNRQDVARYFGTPVLEAGLTIERLSELTGWKYESIKHWLDLGLMNSDEITLRGQRCRVISPTHVVSFLRQYITLSELARTLQTSPGAVSRRFKALDIVGAKPLPNGQRRGGLIRLGDLARLASGEAERQVPEPAVGDLDRLPNRAKPEGTQI